MALVEMVMPKMGESIMEGTILTWLKNVGDTIDQDESVLEVATDKVDTEVPATHAGVLKEILAQEGDVVEVGKTIAIISSNDINDNVSSSPGDSKEVMQKLETVEQELPQQNFPSSNGNNEPTRFYSPLVKNIAKQESISIQELEKVGGTGKEGRVTKRDILDYLAKRTDLKQTIVEVKSQSATPPLQAPMIVSGEDEIIEMDRMRKMIATRMVDSKRISPHVTSFVEADVSQIVAWRNKNKGEFNQRHGGALTFTPLFIEAVANAIKDYPMINISVDGDKIIKKAAINIGMAVALPSGNLIVPVIHNADQLNLTGLSLKVNDLARRARENSLKPDELSGGTFTISNVGSFGNVMGTPIIMQPQVGILALGAVVKKPSVIETNQGDFIGIRHKMFLSHSYDHRVVDGSLGGMFVRRVADYLEKFDVERTL